MTIGRDQALAKSFTKLFERTGWTQGKLPEREGRSPAWVTFAFASSASCASQKPSRCRQTSPSATSVRCGRRPTRIHARRNCGSARSLSSCVRSTWRARMVLAQGGTSTRGSQRRKFLNRSGANSV